MTWRLATMWHYFTIRPIGRFVKIYDEQSKNSRHDIAGTVRYGRRVLVLLILKKTYKDETDTQKILDTSISFNNEQRASF